MRKNLRLAWVVLAVCSVPSRAPADYLGDLYSEQAYLSRETTLNSSIRFRSETILTPHLSPYLQLGNELITKAQNLNRLDTSSYAYAAPGLKGSMGGVSLFGEVRFRQFYVPGGAPGTNGLADGRATLVYGEFLEGSFTQLFRKFLEIYSETVFTSADSYNVIQATFLRAGLRKTLASHTFADLFLEPFITLDRVGHFYNNRSDLKVSLRIQQWAGPVSFSLIASFLANLYFPYAKADPNPYAGRTLGTRLLLVVGGQL
jgi:hypothetical protein